MVPTPLGLVEGKQTVGIQHLAILSLMDTSTSFYSRLEFLLESYVALYLLGT